MSEQPNQSYQSTRSSNAGNSIPKCRHDPFPPELSRWQLIALVITYIFGLLALIYLADQFYFLKLPFSIFGTHIAFGFILTVLLIDRLIRHELNIHKARLVDRSEVDAIIVEAKTVEPRLKDPERPEDYEHKKQDLLEEVQRLEKLGPNGWTEYQILSLNQMLIDFLKLDDLKVLAASRLADLEEYALDSAYHYDIQHYYHWEGCINEAIENVKEEEREKRDDDAENLRAQLRMLLEHVASYEINWADGSVHIRALTTFTVVAIPILLAMGLLPLFHSNGDLYLGIFNWGMLGISGSLTAVLLNIRKSDIVEVGNTQGKKELRNAILGAVLGLVAGIVSYSMISGGIFEGAFFPNITIEKKMAIRDIGLSIFWAIASGYSFEWIFDRIRTVTVGRS